MSYYDEVNGLNFENFKDMLYDNNYNIKYLDLFNALKNKSIPNYYKFINVLDMYLENNRETDLFGNTPQGISLNETLDQAINDETNEIAKRKMMVLYRTIYGNKGGYKKRSNKKRIIERRTRKQLKTKKHKKTRKTKK